MDSSQNPDYINQYISCVGEACGGRVSATCKHKTPLATVSGSNFFILRSAVPGITRALLSQGLFSSWWQKGSVLLVTFGNRERWYWGCDTGHSLTAADIPLPSGSLSDSGFSAEFLKEGPQSKAPCRKIDDSHLYPREGSQARRLGSPATTFSFYSV